MKLRKLCCILVSAVTLLLLTIPVFAESTGSLTVSQVTEQVLLYRVTDENGIAVADFAPALTSPLTEDKLTPELARTLSNYAKEHNITGQALSPNALSDAIFPDLDLGGYLVCSTAQPGEFAPFLINIPMTIGGKPVFDIQATPKSETPSDPTGPVEPIEPKPNIPQTGNIQWPKYLLLILGGMAILAGFVETLRGQEKRYE